MDGEDMKILQNTAFILAADSKNLPMQYACRSTISYA